MSRNREKKASTALAFYFRNCVRRCLTHMHIRDYSSLNETNNASEGNTMTREEFDAKQAKIIAAYQNHPNAISAFNGPNAVCRDFDDAVFASAENAGQDFNEQTHPVEFLEMFESSLEGILTA